MKFHPFAAWLHGETALLNHSGAVPGVPGGMREPWGAVVGPNLHQHTPGKGWAGFKHLIQTADPLGFKTHPCHSLLPL